MSDSGAETISTSLAPKVDSKVPFVVAIVATYNRKPELAALLALLAETPGVQAVVVADNEGDPEVRQLVRRANLCAEYVATGVNRGPGTGINRAIECARQKWPQSLSHYWILDDDVRFAPDTLTKLLAALRQNHAQFVAPVITEPSGAVFAWPDLKSRAMRKLFSSRNRCDLAGFANGIDQQNLPEVRASLGFFLMERICYDCLDPIREDFWIQGEDVEYTSRVARRFRAVFCPSAAIEHYWGAPSDQQNPRRAAYFKACAALQNNLFLLLHRLPTSFVLRSFLGSLQRFVLLHLRSREALFDFFSIIWYASVRAQPAGASSGELLRERRRDYGPP